MKTFFVLLIVFGLGWGLPLQLVNITTTPAVEILSAAQPEITKAQSSTSSTTANSSETKKNIDLLKRLFYADHDDLQFGRKTLDLSGLDLTGEDVMRILHSLNTSVLVSVARLDLSRNRVFSLPQRVWPLELEYRLQELRLDHNQLYIHESLDLWATRFELLRLLSLKKLSLSHCGLTSQVSQWQLEYPSSVETLDLSYNSLVEVPAKLSRVSSLQHLNLSHNNIGFLGGQVAQLNQLRTLDLSHNQIVAMFNDPLTQLVYLETVNLDHNELSKPPKLYQFNGSYQPRMYLSLSSNRFLCGSDFKELLEMKRIKIVDKSNATCFDSYQVEHLISNMTANYQTYRWQVVKEKLSVAKDWVGDNLTSSITVYESIGWLLFAVSLILIFYLCKKKTTAPSNAPYEQGYLTL